MNRKRFIRIRNAVTASCLGGVAVVAWLNPTVDATLSNPIEPAPREPTRVEHLIQSGTCWTTEDPSPLDPMELPSGVIISRDGGKPHLSRRNRVIGMALDHALGGPQTPGLTVIAFCDFTRGVAA